MKSNPFVIGVIAIVTTYTGSLIWQHSQNVSQLSASKKATDEPQWKSIQNLEISSKEMDTRLRVIENVVGLNRIMDYLDAVRDGETLIITKNSISIKTKDTTVPPKPNNTEVMPLIPEAPKNTRTNHINNMQRQAPIDLLNKMQKARKNKKNIQEYIEQKQLR